MRVLLTCDPEIPVPPVQYGGIERIVDILVNGLIARGLHVTLCANKDSQVPCNLVKWKGVKSQHIPDTIKNTVTLTQTVLKSKPDVIHSFSRLAYMSLVMPLGTPKIMSYQREPSISQVKKARYLSARNSLYFTGCSDYITNQLLPHAKACTIYNSAPFDKYKLNVKTDHNAPLVFLGRIEEIKGVHDAIVVAQKTGKRLVIAGNIPIGKEDYFNTKVMPYLNQQIEYVGSVDDEKKNWLLGNAAALLMPIRWNEPFGIVMAEAMACGTPVIGLARGSVPEVIQHNQTGYTCGSLEEMTQAVYQLGKLDRRKIRQVAQQKFGEQVMVESYLRLYKRILSNKKQFHL